MSYPARMRPNRYALNASKFLSADETQHLDLLLRRYLEHENFRDALILLIALRTGARAQEILNLRRCDFFLRENQGHVLIRGIKGSNDRELPLPYWVTRKLKLVVANCEHPEQLLFPIGYHRLREIWLEYRPVQKPFKALRHTFAINLYYRTKDIRLVMVALGHRQIANTLIYLDYAYSAHELMRIVY